MTVAILPILLMTKQPPTVPITAPTLIIEPISDISLEEKFSGGSANCRLAGDDHPTAAPRASAPRVAETKIM
jgi:hypothetical protein